MQRQSNYSLNLHFFKLCDICANMQACEYAAKTNKECAVFIQNRLIFEEMVEILRIPYNTTVSLQKADIGLSDFFGYWLLLNIKMKKMAERNSPTTSLAECLVTAINDRERQLLDNNIMAMCLFLDRRFSSEQTLPRIELAKMSLLRMYRRQEKLLAGEQQVNNISFSLDSTGNCLEDYFGDVATTTQEIQHKSDAQLLEIFSKFEMEEQSRLHSKTIIMEYWESMKTKYPELYSLALILFAVPPTQCLIEQNFSTLALVFNKKRYNLKQEILEHIMNISLNKDLFYEVCEEHIQALA